MTDRPPLRARLHRYKLTATELAVLQAMVEHCSDGSTIWASIRRIAAYSNLCKRTVQRVINGVNRNGRHIPGLRDRGILSQVAPANVAKHRPATYRLNEQACEEDPRMAPYLTRQQELPGIRRRPIPGEPIPDRPLVAQGHQPGDTGSPDLVAQGHQPGDTGSPDSKAFDPKAMDPKPLTHHADGAMTMPAWLAIKEQLRSELSPEEWNLWVRPARLFRMMDDKTMLIAVPPSSAIMAAAAARKGLLNEIAARGGLRAVLTKYPDEWEREQLKERFGEKTA